MFTILVCWMSFTFVCFLWGEISIALYKSFTQKKESYSLIETLTIGICAVGTILCFTSIQAPSGIGVTVALTAIPALYFVFKRKQGFQLFNKLSEKFKALSKTQAAFSIITLLLFLIFITMPPQLPDTFIYHIQNMMWNEEYSVVPGVANLQHRFAFNSNSLLLSSAFGFRQLFGQFIFGINALYMAMMLIYVINNMVRKKPFPIVILSLAAFIILCLQYKMHIASPSTDLLPNMLIIFLMLVMFTNKNSLTEKSLLFWIVPVFCITLKLSLVIICIFCIYILAGFIRSKSYRNITFLSVWSLLIIVPWLIRNVIISGYLLFPYPDIDLFNADWKLPLETVINEKAYIEAQNTIQAASGQPFATRLQIWLSGISHLELGILCSTLISPLLMIAAYWKDRRTKRKGRSGLYLMWAMAFVGFIFCFYMVPSFGCSFGLLLIASSIPLYLLATYIKKDLSYAVTNLFLLTGIVFLGIISVRYFKSIKDPSLPYSYLLYLPQDIDSTEFKKRQRIIPKKTNGGMLNIASEGNCIDCPLPCVKEGINVEMRGNALQDGFRTKRRR